MMNMMNMMNVPFLEKVKKILDLEGPLNIFSSPIAKRSQIIMFIMFIMFTMPQSLIYQQ